MLKRAGVGGTVLLWLYIDEVGAVQRTVLAESRGYEHLDEAARKVAEKMELRPAINRDKTTAVWLAQSIDFSVTRVADGRSSPIVDYCFPRGSWRGGQLRPLSRR